MSVVVIGIDVIEDKKYQNAKTSILVFLLINKRNITKILQQN